MDRRSGDGEIKDNPLTSQSLEEKHFPDFEMLDAKIASVEKHYLQFHFQEGESVLKSSELKNMTDFFEREKNCLHDL